MSVSSAFGYGVLYFLTSSTMLVFNKLAISYYPAPALITMLQYVFCVLGIALLRIFKVIELKFLSATQVKEYLPVPLLFACAVFANNKILQYSNIETFIVIRNTTPLFVAALEFLFLGKNLPNKRALLAFMLIIGGALGYAKSEAGIELNSYFWGTVYLSVFCIENVFVKHIFNKIEMTTCERMLYTNLISIPVQPIFMFITSEYLRYPFLYPDREVTDAKLELVLTTNSLTFIGLSCIGGFLISFAGIGFRSRVSATTFTLIGVVNKLITLTVNFLMWDQHATAVGILALVVCLGGSTVYKPASLREKGSISSRAWESVNSLVCGCLGQVQLVRDGQAAGGCEKADGVSDNTGSDREEAEKLLGGKENV